MKFFFKVLQVIAIVIKPCYFDGHHLEFLNLSDYFF